MGVSLKPVTILLMVTLFASCLILTQSSSAQSIPKPSIPEYTIKLAAYPYDEPPTTTVDPYTGKTVTTQAGYHLENKSIEITIKNQPFRSSNGTPYGFLHFEVCWKGHYETDWHRFTVSASNCETYYETGSSTMHFVNPNAPFTVANFGLGDNPQIQNRLGDVSSDGQIDFRIQAFLGNKERVYGDYVPPWPDRPYFDVFKGEQSDYSEIQTIRMSDGSVTVTAPASPAPTPTPTDTETQNTPAPSVPEFSFATVLPLFVIMLLAVGLVKSKTRFLG